MDGVTAKFINITFLIPSSRCKCPQSYIIQLFLEFVLRFVVISLSRIVSSSFRENKPHILKYTSLFMLRFSSHALPFKMEGCKQIKQVF